MKKLFYFLFNSSICILLFVNGRAQVTTSFGPEVGIGVSALNYINEDFTAGFTVQCGGTAHIQIGRFFAIRPSALLKFSFYQNADILDKKTTTISRVAFPLAFMYSRSFSNSNQLYVGAGPQLQYALGGQSDYNADYIKRKIKFGHAEHDDLRPLDLGLHFKAGFNFNTGLALNIFFNAGLTDIDPRSNYKIKSIDMIGFSFAWLFGNKKSD